MSASDRRGEVMVVAWAIFFTYLVAARLVGNLFPLSVFDMYQAHAPEMVGRVIAVDASTQAAELGAYEAYACDDTLTMARVEDRCGTEARPLDYVLRDQAELLEARAGDPGDGAEPIDLVLRAYVLSARPDEAPFSDCVVTHCRARRRDAR